MATASDHASRPLLDVVLSHLLARYGSDYSPPVLARAVMRAVFALGEHATPAAVESLAHALMLGEPEPAHHWEVPPLPLAVSA